MLSQSLIFNILFFIDPTKFAARGKLQPSPHTDDGLAGLL